MQESFWMSKILVGLIINIEMLRNQNEEGAEPTLVSGEIYSYYYETFCNGVCFDVLLVRLPTLPQGFA